MEKAINGQQFDINEPTKTEADGLEVRIPIMKISEEIRHLIDDIWIIPESMLLPAVKTLMEYDQVMTEPSASITIAACIKNQSLISGKKVAAIITGSHLKSSLLSQLAETERHKTHGCLRPIHNRRREIKYRCKNTNRVNRLRG